jgi:hypothetical protein
MLQQKETLTAGEYIQSESGQHIAVMTESGAFAVYCNCAMWGTSDTHTCSESSKSWSTETNHNIGGYLYMQNSGNLVVFGAGNGKKWESGTDDCVSGNKACYLHLRNDGTLMSYYGTSVTWVENYEGCA